MILFDDTIGNLQSVQYQAQSLIQIHQVRKTEFVRLRLSSASIRFSRIQHVRSPYHMM